ncbi:AarF/ABC1/UbiB kinase family protein [Gordonia sp. HY002]|uniref:ABC1 kinase family protein n=1 Tax=Gordonia zhenghanii TaxID=2911516 RepID=UPI001EEF8679|nr:AarF/ABC1/UbiB kinase family protein [Gordonia zhenghanii]MCF8571695.1 AarF/ABC1/UbiB kinase family protein [Gordonia zhenghanii]MCF8602719.1 AarF/ABC1/UbiB kinase family protein [Gordonia zhenghanii]
MTDKDVSADDESSRSRLRRGTSLGGVAAKHAVRVAATSATARFKSSEEVASARDQAALRLADDLVAVLGGMRGAAHKLGQVIAMIDVGLATRDTRDEFSRRLEPLFSVAPPWNDRAMKRVLEKSLGARFSQIAHLEGPIAAASIGQVYRARLSDGREVAVKVKYPDIDRMVAADLKNLSLLTRVIGSHIRAANPDEIVDEVVRQIRTELDFAAECANQQRFAERFEGHPAFRIPGVVEEFCTDEVLVSEFVDGMDVKGASELDAPDRDLIGETIYRFYCGEMYGTGDFSADPHPGNVLILPDKTVAFLDFGLCVSLDARELKFEQDVFSALLRGDTGHAYQLVRDAGFIVDPDSLDAEQFAEYALASVGWHLHPGPQTITRATARRAATAAVSPSGRYVGRMGRQRMVEGHGFGRRNELATCALLGRLEATAPWSEISREILGMRAPATPLGESIAAWRLRSD